MHRFQDIVMLIKRYNAQLSSERRITKATALRLKHKTHCKPKLPRVANLLKLFVSTFLVTVAPMFLYPWLL